MPAQEVTLREVIVLSDEATQALCPNVRTMSPPLDYDSAIHQAHLLSQRLNPSSPPLPSPLTTPCTLVSHLSLRVFPYFHLPWPVTLLLPLPLTGLLALQTFTRKSPTKTFNGPGKAYHQLGSNIPHYPFPMPPPLYLFLGYSSRNRPLSLPRSHVALGP